MSPPRRFEAAARYESFTTQAAKQLCVTQGAVSRQVELESVASSSLSSAVRLIGAIGTEQLQQWRASCVLTASISPDFVASMP